MGRLQSGGRINRDQKINFSFDGKPCVGYQGDTIASALLANGISTVGRSWKYHRPRGIVGDGAEEPNALFQIEDGAHTIPNVRGTQAEIYEGMVVKSTNAWPSLKFDLLSVNGLFARFLPAGFYYKTFMWPQKFWMAYEHMIRKASGLGESPRLPDQDHYEKTNAHCDVLVVGSGPAGLMAALTAGRAGARVILADEQAEFGGRLLSDRSQINGKPAAEWVSAVVAELSAMPDVTLVKRGTVFGYHDGNFATIAERLTDHLALADRTGPRERNWRVRAKQVVLATGAHERPIVFGNNDLPGVMLASAVSSYLNRYGVKPGQKAVVFANNENAYQTVLDLDDAGVTVAAVIDPRVRPRGPLVSEAGARNINIVPNTVVVEAKGWGKLSSVIAKSRDEGGKRVVHVFHKINCDLLAVSGGWNPAIHLLAQSGGKVSWDDNKHCFVPNVIVQPQVSVGAANGSFTLQQCLAEGMQGGLECAQAAGVKAEAIAIPETAEEDYLIEEMWRSPVGKKPWRGPKQFVDPQNDVGVSDIFLAAREGYHSIEHVKRYTALGFGTDQGKIGNIVGMAILAEALGKDIPSTGTTTFRPNYTPVSFGGIAGPEIKGTLFDPVRKTAMHTWHEENGALFENVGQWHRPWFYPKDGEDMHAAVNRECLATRNSVGIMDASTLGKIEVVGPDASEFLNRVYTNAWKKLGIDCARYGFMLGEDGMVMDDGVTVRLDEHRYFMHTTTGGAASVLSWLESWLQTEWPELEVYLTSVTDHWATAAVVGPNSHNVVSKVVQGIDFDKEAFPFMTSRRGSVELSDGSEVAVRVNRISFSGELAYEVNVSANYGRAVWEALMAAGEEYDITPYGTESMHVLRAEKGFVIVGQDTDGSVTPEDLGMQWIMSKTKDYLGRRSLARADSQREDRKQLVGLLTKDPQRVLPEGGQIVATPSGEIPIPMLGHVTSSYFSACLGHSIAMALVKGGRQRQGETVYVAMPNGEMIPAEIGSTVFYDPEGEKQNV
ncbi:MAG: sarcosine oxidase subunit alpha [Pseudomonadota bacterium]